MLWSRERFKEYWLAEETAGCADNAQWNRKPFRPRQADMCGDERSWVSAAPFQG